MKRLIEAAMVLACMVSCTPDLAVQDHSFEFSSRIEYDTQEKCHYLRLTLDKGDTRKEYTLHYRFDGEETTRLYRGGEPLSDGSSITFPEDRTISFRTDPLKGGRHTLDIELVSDRYSKAHQETLVLSEEPFSIDAEVDTGNKKASVIHFNLTDGDRESRYSVKLTIDGLDYPQVHGLDFSGSRRRSLELPVLLPGEHQLILTMNNGMSEEVRTLTFTEPLRYPDVILSVEISEKGNLVIIPLTNPYKIRFHGTTRLSMTASADIVEFGGNAVDEISKVRKQKIKTLDQTFSNEGGSDEWTMIADRMTVKEELTSKTEQSSKYAWFPNTMYIFRGYETVKYKITEETVELELTAELFEGLNVKISNEYENLSVYGKKPGKGVWDLPSDDKQDK